MSTVYIVLASITALATTATIIAVEGGIAVAGWPFAALLLLIGGILDLGPR